MCRAPPPLTGNRPRAAGSGRDACSVFRTKFLPWHWLSVKTLQILRLTGSQLVLLTEQNRSGILSRHVLQRSDGEGSFHAYDGGYSTFNSIKSMSSGDTVKTTVRLPADLHWRFQAERARRRLSNEKAICDAFSSWIASTAGAPEDGSQDPAQGSTGIRVAGKAERQCVQRLLGILRNSSNRPFADAVAAVIDAFYEPRAEISLVRRQPDATLDQPLTAIRVSGKKRKRATARKRVPQ